MEHSSNSNNSNSCLHLNSQLLNNNNNLKKILILLIINQMALWLQKISIKPPIGKLIVISNNSRDNQ